MQGMVEALGGDIYSYAYRLRYTGGHGSDIVLVCNLQDGIYYVLAMKCLRARRDQERDPPNIMAWASSTSNRAHLSGSFTDANYLLPQ